MDESIDWMIEKNPQAFKMMNSIQRLQDMKDFTRSEVRPWNCRAGQKSLVIRADGTLTPHFPMHSVTYDWGTIENRTFNVRQLNEVKTVCQAHCFSTLDHNLGYSCNAPRINRGVVRQAVPAFQGVTGSFD